MFDFDNIWDICKNNTMLSKDRFEVIYNEISLVKNTYPMAEVGVFRGGVAKMLCLLNKDFNVYLFDTFEGMPNKHSDFDVMDTGDIRCGEFKDLELKNIEIFFEQDKNAVFKIGTFPETSKGLENEIFSFCHIDCDLYYSCLESMNFFYPRLCKKGLIIVDDYGRPECPGVKKSIDEYCNENNILINVLPDFQVIIRKK